MEKPETISGNVEKTVSKFANASLVAVEMPGAVLKGIGAGLKNVIAERKQARAAKKVVVEEKAEVIV